MYQILNQRLQSILESGKLNTLSESRIGIEKESLRVAQAGEISQVLHPESLGSALTNEYITTDFSEALTELITPPCNSIKDVLQFLDELQQYVYSNLADETLWSTSIPCVVSGESSIHIAQYGTSNLAKMKTAYREGLSNRYGRMMQVIAGVHFNYSFSDSFWNVYQQMENETGDRRNFKSKHYMGLVRNMLRFGWLIPYLFGASPAICRSFVDGEQGLLEAFNENTFYEPFATSLRMGDIGYTNTKESMAGIKANYDSLETYIESLQCAINTPFQPYEEIGVKVDGEYRQLNANILQIENEYYSTVRPKQVLKGNEKPTTALADRGVEYIEIRSLDVNAFDPLGVNEEQLYFLEVFAVFCLLHESNVLLESEINEIDINLILVAHRGRDPELNLSCCGDNVSLKDWANTLCDAMSGVAECLDLAHTSSGNKQTAYTDSLEKQKHCINNSNLTPSARMLESMRKNNEGFFHFARRMSNNHHDYFNEKQLSPEKRAFFDKAVADSLLKQKKIESDETMGFDEFLQDYFDSG